LDTNQSYAPGSPQYAWLLGDLESDAQPWTFVFFHHPAYSSGNHGSTGEVQTYLAPLLETYGVDMVFSGHDHHYERSCPILDGACVPSGESGGVVYVVTGGTGAPLHEVSGDWFTACAESQYHFIVVHINDCLLRLEAVDASGAVFDSYGIDQCSGSSPTPHGLWLPVVAGGQ